MAIVRMSMDSIVASQDVDRARIETTMDDEIRRHMVEDGFDRDAPFAGLRELVPVATIRKRTGLSQDKFAEALGIPPATLRN